MRIAHFGSFDVANYGDLLYPLVLERRIRELLASADSSGEIDLVHFSPLGGGPVWEDARRTLPVRELFDHGRFDAVILGGGHLVHVLPTQLPAYQATRGLADTAYAELWLGAAQLAERDGARLIWNAPGVPRALDGRAAELLRAATDRVDYLAVRDEASAEHLRRSGVATEINVVPDTALDVARLWSGEQLDAAYAGLVPDGASLQRAIAVHVKERYLREPCAMVAARLDQLCEHFGATAILLALGPCHGDDACARRVASAMHTGPIVVDRPASLIFLTAALARSAMYLGSSLHGLIVASAFGRPAWCVATEQANGARKFSGFLRQVDAEARLCPTWEAACAAVSSEWPAHVGAARERLDAHWRRIGELLARHPATARATPHVASAALVFTPSATQLAILEAQAEIAATSTGRLDRCEQERDAAKRRSSKFSARLAERNEQLKASAAREKQLSRQLAEAQRQTRRHARDVAMLSAWIDQLRRGLNALLATRRWRLGNWIGDCVHRLRGGDKGPLATDWLRDVFRRHEQWRDANATGLSQEQSRVAGVECTHSPPDRANWGRASTLDPSHPAFFVDAGISSRFTTIIVPVHNAVDPVRACLESLMTHTDARHEIVLVDDASDMDAARLLRQFAERRGNTVLLRGDERQGYTRAANRGWRAARGDYVVLLNSDTVVTLGWLERLIAGLESDASIGLAGPLSNAASWQSVPERFDAQGDWAVNGLPDGWHPDAMAQLVARVSSRAYPRVPLLNGYCLTIRRAVWERIGYFDEQSFPDGYGEETDYCLRAAAAGFALAVADDAYVFHAKSQSYGHARRAELTERGQQALRRKHGATAIQNAVVECRDEPVLAALGGRVRQAMQVPREHGSWPSVLFLLPVRGGGGGAHSVVQEAAGMRQLGARAGVAIEERFATEFERHYPEWFREGLFFAYRDRAELVRYAGDFDVAVATVYFSVRELRRIVDAHPRLLPAYYVQDYEPKFFPRWSRHHCEARRTYGALPGMVHFAKTAWVREEVGRRHGMTVHPVTASLDHAVYFPGARTQTERALRIAAMIRPATPYRGAARTLRVLREVRRRHPDVELHFFGAMDDEQSGLTAGESDEHWHGRLTREGVADVLRASDVFADFSDYQAFGRTGLEAMACGAAVILPEAGGASEYATHEANSLLVDTRDDAACLAAVERSLDEPELRARFASAGIETAARYSIEAAARAELELFQREIQRRNGDRTAATTFGVHTSGGERPVRVHAILPRAGAGWPGSSYVRVLLPLQHVSLRGGVSLTYGASETKAPNNAEVILVQRTAIGDCDQARQLVEACRRRGRRLVCELDDDLWNLPLDHPERRRYRRLLPALEYLVEQADVVTAPTPNLAQSLARRSGHVRVIANALDEAMWFAPPSKTQRHDEQIRVLLMGTRTHAADLEIVAPAARRLVREFGDRVRFDVVGCVGRGARGDWYRALRVPPNAGEYPAFVRWLRRRHRWQIGLAPLRANAFNASKSPLKYLDYGALGLAGVYSDVPAYANTVRQLETGLLTGDDADSWFEAVRALVLDEELRRALSQAALADVRQRHGLASTTARWLASLTGAEQIADDSAQALAAGRL